MTSRNQREGYYGGKARAYEAVTELGNGFTIWKRVYVRNARYHNGHGLKHRTDNCQICHGKKGGVRGNENRINGLVVCDYCTADGSYKEHHAI